MNNLSNALERAAKYPHFKLERSANNDEWCVTVGHRNIGHDNSWLPTTHYQASSTLAELINRALDDYDHVKLSLDKLIKDNPDRATEFIEYRRYMLDGHISGGVS